MAGETSLIQGGAGALCAQWLANRTLGAAKTTQRPPSALLDHSKPADLTLPPAQTGKRKRAGSGGRQPALPDSQYDETLSFHRAGSQTGDDPLLEDEDEQEQRYCDDDGGSHDLAEWFLEGDLAGEKGDGNRHRPRVGLNGRKGEREQVFVPGIDEGEKASGDQRRHRQGQQNLVEGLERRRAVHLRRLH